MPEEVNVDNRKDFLLLLLAAAEAEPIVGVTRLLKYVFLLQQRFHWDERFGIKDGYEFDAYDYGPFDADIYDDLTLLENVGLIKSEPTTQPEPLAERVEFAKQAFESGTSDPEVLPWESEDVIRSYSLTGKGREFVDRMRLDSETRSELEGLKKEWNHRSLTELLRWLYRVYPNYATETRLTHLRPATS
jgi:uncharacterized protein YwgA